MSSNDESDKENYDQIVPDISAAGAGTSDNQLPDADLQSPNLSNEKSLETVFVPRMVTPLKLNLSKRKCDPNLTNQSMVLM